MTIQYQDKEGRYILPISKWKVLYDTEYKLITLYHSFEDWSLSTLREYPPYWSLTPGQKSKRRFERKTDLQKRLGELE